MPLPPKRLDPDDFRLPKVFEAFYPVKFVSDDTIAIMYSKPIVEGSLPPRPSEFDMLSEANFDGFSRQTYVAIPAPRLEPDPVDRAPGRKFGRQEISVLSAGSRHNMQETQFSTSVPSNAIWRSRM